MLALGALLLVGGFAAALLVSIVSPGSVNPGLTGALSVPPVFLMIAGLVALSGPRRVVVTDEALVIMRAAGVRRVPWSAVASVRLERDESLVSSWHTKPKNPAGKGRLDHQMLTLSDDNGRRIARLRSTSFEAFGVLAETIEAKCDVARGAPTRDRDDERVKAVRKARIMGFIAIPFGLLLVFAVYWMITRELYARETDRALAETGVVIDAELTDHRMHNGIAPRVEYRFTDPAGENHDNDVMLDIDAWRDLRDAPTIPVVYLPEDPGVHRPVTGYSEPNRMSNLILVAVGVAGALVPGFLLVAGVFQIMGIDGVHLDGKGLRVTRVGEPPAA
ncbi:MAG: hypothetical protein RIB60_00740 [Phycisphaerales bacterium]